MAAQTWTKLMVGAALVAAAIPLSVSAQPAIAAPCSDIEVVFARGTAEPPGLGITGTAFVEALRAQAGGRSVSSYAVNYQASADFGNPLSLAHTVMDGIRDAQAHVISTATACPGTRIVLAGYSQGAVVSGFATMGGTPDGVPPQWSADVPAAMPSEVSNNVAAVVLFAKPSDRWMREAGAPPVAIGPAYAGKTVDYCIGGDTICDGSGLSEPNALHVLYGFNGMAFAGAGYAASRI